MKLSICLFFKLKTWTMQMKVNYCKINKYNEDAHAMTMTVAVILKVAREFSLVVT